jgi:hypothetical protein
MEPTANEWLQLLAPFGSAGLVLAVLRWWLNRLESRIDCFEKAQHACQLTNAKEYATRKDHGKLCDKVDGIDTRVTILESKS